MIETDVLIIGSGIAGLATALYIRQFQPGCRIDILSKTSLQENNTQYAQGGIAAVWDDQIDSTGSHLQDTLNAGDGLCDEEIVRLVVEEGPARVRELIEWGARFDKKSGASEYDLGVEGGHSHHRILHHKDVTGKEIHRALRETIKRAHNIHLHEQAFAVDIITQHHLGRNITRLTPDIECYGAYIVREDSTGVEKILAKRCVLATGGIGECYKATTNPPVATGDGIAMTYRAKGRIANMEFVQFHPTSLYSASGESPSFLISEAVRGAGAYLVNADGVAFMKNYHPLKDLAPRDVVARAIDNEMKKSGMDHVFLDARGIAADRFEAHFPNILRKCKAVGLDPAVDLLPVVPAAHYACGGIAVDSSGQSSIKNLYAVGECSCTGLHGSNRLASNSLLEALVFGRKAAENLSRKLDKDNWKEGIPDWNAERTTDPREKVLLTQSLKELKEIMSFYVRIIRSDERLQRALNRLELLYHETETLYRKSVVSPQLCELRNMITIGYLITRSATLRKESRGLHFTSDYPDKNEVFVENSYL